MEYAGYDHPLKESKQSLPAVTPGFSFYLWYQSPRVSVRAGQYPASQSTDRTCRQALWKRSMSLMAAGCERFVVGRQRLGLEAVRINKGKETDVDSREGKE